MAILILLEKSQPQVGEIYRLLATFQGANTIARKSVVHFANHSIHEHDKSGLREILKHIEVRAKEVDRYAEFANAKNEGRPHRNPEKLYEHKIDKDLFSQISEQDVKRIMES